MQVAGIGDDWGRRALKAVAVFGFVGFLMLLGVYQCPFALMTHQPCPGCGLTRASRALLSGDVHAAMHFHPLVFGALPLLALFFGTNFVMYVRSGTWGWMEQRASRLLTWLFGVFFVLLVVVWVARFFGAFGGPVSVE